MGFINTEQRTKLRWRLKRFFIIIIIIIFFVSFLCVCGGLFADIVRSINLLTYLRNFLQGAPYLMMAKNDSTLSGNEKYVGYEWETVDGKYWRRNTPWKWWMRNTWDTAPTWPRWLLNTSDFRTRWNWSKTTRVRVSANVDASTVWSWNWSKTTSTAPRTRTTSGTASSANSSEKSAN